MTQAHREAASRAQTALLSVVTHAQEVCPAVIRGAPPAEIERLRGQAHDALDAYVDAWLEAGALVREIGKANG